MQVFVRDNNVDQALKVLKKKMQREGIFREMKLRGHYEKPSEKENAGEGGSYPPRPQARAQENAARGPAADEAPGGPRSPGRAGPARGPALIEASEFQSRLARTARSTAQLSTPARSSPLPSSVGYTIATRGYSFSGGTLDRNRTRVPKAKKKAPRQRG